MTSMHFDRNNLPEVKYSFNDPHEREKLGEVILYVAAKCQNDETFCSTFLNKVLWHADLMSYAVRGKPITGTAYQRLDHGPAPVAMLPVRAKLEEQGALAMQYRRYGRGTQKRPVALREANLDNFSGTDVEFINKAIEVFRGQSAKNISEWSHQRGWHSVKNRELIPYNAVWLSEEPITAGDVREAQELIAVHGWTDV